MPRTRSLAWSELKVGLLTVFAIVMTTVLIFMLSGESGFFWQRYSIKTVFTDVAGLKPGAPVRVAGVEIGSVTGVDFIGDSVEVVMQVSRDRQHLITDRSTAVLGSVSLLGEAAVDISASAAGTPIPEWGYVPTGKTGGSIAGVATQATAGLEQATQLISDLRGGRGTAGKLFTDDALYAELTKFLMAAEEVTGRLNDVTSKINSGEGTLGRLIANDASGKALEASLQNLENVTARIRAGEGSLGKLLTDDALVRSLTSTTTNLDAITGRMNRGEGTLGKLATNDELFTRLNSTSDRMDKLIASLQQGEGSAGQLLRDKQLYENMTGAVGELRDLVKDIRADPKKYLNVKVSLF
jgi:phospholipid/cholesterol/gamma-HCH transport system substrate-binding protein